MYRECIEKRIINTNTAQITALDSSNNTVDAPCLRHCVGKASTVSSKQASRWYIDHLLYLYNHLDLENEF